MYTFFHRVSDRSQIHRTTSRYHHLQPSGHDARHQSGSHRHFRRVDIEGDFRWVNFERKLNAAFAKHIENRIESLGQQVEPGSLLLSDLDTRLAAMDAQGIDMQALSINPYWYRAGRDAAVVPSRTYSFLLSFIFFLQFQIF